MASKSRFGLFSQAPPLAIGDDSLFRSKQGNYSFIQQYGAKTESQNLNPGTYLLVIIEQEWARMPLLAIPKAFTPVIDILILKKWTICTIKSFIRHLISTKGSSSLEVALIIWQRYLTNIRIKILHLNKGQREMRQAE